MSETYSITECIVNVVRNTNYLKHMLVQSNPFPLMGIEHYFTPSDNHKYCKFCSYKEENLNHIKK